MKKFRGVDFYGVDGLLSEEELMARQSVRDFVDAKLLPVIREAWEEGARRQPNQAITATGRPSANHDQASPQ